ncbi:hypothetical protein L208DRAFT_1419999, partial [Tricholoma matsutake]
MKFSQSLVFLVTTALTIPSTLANFHITLVSSNKLWAIPSSEYSCIGMFRDSVFIKSASALLTDYIRIPAGLCGEGPLNMYGKSDGTWIFYRAGMTQVVGSCYSNVAYMQCPSGQNSFPVQDQLVCYTTIC